MRVTRGRAERVERHAARLRRDAERLGLPPPDRIAVEAFLVDAARTHFGVGDGILRIEWSRSAHEAGAEAPNGVAMALVAVPRAVGPESDTWRAADSAAIHPGAGDRHGTKFVDVLAYDLAREELRQSDLDEVLLYDAAGLLVEGARSNFLVALDRGRLVTPELGLGAVEGLGLTIVRENHPEIREARLTRADLAEARELLSVNAVRGVTPIIELNGKPVGGGHPGVWAARLSETFRPI